MTQNRSLVMEDSPSSTVDLSASLGRLMGIFLSADKQHLAQKTRSLLVADSSWSRNSFLKVILCDL